MQWIPTLQRICLELLAWSQEPYFQLQKRRMQLLPEQAANTLVQLLLQLQRLHAPTQLEAFRHCLTALHIGPSSGIHLDAEWLAYICTSLRQLHFLALTDMPRLKDKSLAPLPALAAQLQHLSLSGCRGVTNKSLPLLGQLTSLRSLELTGTSIKSPALHQLTALQQLTRLHLGGCDVTDDDVTCHITGFSALQDLDMWGCTAGDAAARHIAHNLSGLRRLNMAWSQISSALPLPSGLQQLDLSHCKLQGPASDADFVSAAEMRQLQVLVLVQAVVDAAACELLEVLLRACAASLRVLDLTNAALDSQLLLLLALESATQLTALSLSGTHLSDDFLPALAACTSLHTLNLSHNPGITAAGAAATLPGFAATLQQLDVGHTGVDDAVLPVLSQLPQLQQLVLADTAVTWDLKQFAPATTPAGPPSAAAAAGAAGIEGRSSIVTGWPRLRLLDVSNTQLTDAGCLQLAANMEAAAASKGTHAAAAGTSRSMQQQQARLSGAASARSAVGGGGLRVLLVGSASSKLGRKALAGIGRLGTLQQLTLQGWSLVGRDLQHLQGLQDLQALHVRAADPWLLPDDALLQLTEELPQLSSISRDSRQLLPCRGSPRGSASDGAAAGVGGSSTAAPAAGSAGHYGLTAAGGVDESSSSSSDTSGTGSTYSQRSIWPAGRLLQEVHSTAAFTVPWLAQQVRQRFTPAHALAASQPPAGSSSKQAPRDRRAGAAAAALNVSQRGSKQAASSKTTGSGGGSTVYRRLSAFDERYRYTSEALLALRGQARPDASSDGDSEDARQLQPALPFEIRAGTGW